MEDMHEDIDEDIDEDIIEDIEDYEVIFIISEIKVKFISPILSLSVKFRPTRHNFSHV